MMRRQLLLCALLLAAGFVGNIIRAELTDEEKKQLCQKSRERMRTVAHPTAEASATPHHKPKPAKHPPAKKKKPATPKPPTGEEEPTQRTPRPTPAQTPTH